MTAQINRSVYDLRLKLIYFQSGAKKQFVWMPNFCQNQCFRKLGGWKNFGWQIFERPKNYQFVAKIQTHNKQVKFFWAISHFQKYLLQMIFGPSSPLSLSSLSVLYHSLPITAPLSLSPLPSVAHCPLICFWVKMKIFRSSLFVFFSSSCSKW